MKIIDTFEDKTKCPYCGKDLNLTVEVESKMKSCSTLPWAKINTVSYPNEDKVELSDVDLAHPGKPHTMHNVRCLIPSAPAKFWQCEFNHGLGTIEEVGIKNSTKNGQWEVELNPGEF